MLPSIVMVLGVNGSTTINHVPPAAYPLTIPSMSGKFFSFLCQHVPLFVNTLQLHVCMYNLCSRVVLGIVMLGLSHFV